MKAENKQTQTKQAQGATTVHVSKQPLVRPPVIPPFSKGKKIRLDNKARFFARTRRGI